MTNQRVLQICHGYKGPFVHICRQYVAALKHTQVTTVFLTGEEDTSIANQIDGKVIFLGYASRQLAGLKRAPLKALVKLCRDEKYDLVVGHRYKAIYLACLLDRQFNFRHRWSRRFFLRIFGKKMVLAGVSRSVALDLKADLKKVNAANRVIVLPNVINRDESFILSKSDARQRLGISPDDFVVGSIGRLVEKKNFSLLLQAFAACPEEFGRLVIIGEGPQRALLESLKSKLGLDDRLSLLGHISDAANVVSAFDVFVLSSGTAEAFGIVLLEAMQAKVPVISTNALGPAEVVADAGILFKNGDVDDLKRALTFIRGCSIGHREEIGGLGAARVAAVYSIQQLTHALTENFDIKIA
jgi:glycosyltransferase involved in cell wall biosynthesis